MRILGLILISISIQNTFSSLPVDGSVAIIGDSKNLINFGYNKASEVLNGIFTFAKKLDETKSLDFLLGAWNNKYALNTKLKNMGENFNTTLVAAGILDWLSKEKNANLGVVVSKYLESIGEAGIAAFINQNKETSFGPLITKKLGDFSVEAGAFYNVVQKSLDNVGVKLMSDSGSTIFGIGKLFGDLLVQLNLNGFLNHEYIEFAHAENLFYNYTEKYLQGLVSFNGRKEFSNGLSYNFNGQLNNYSLNSNAIVKYQKLPFELIGQLSSVEGLTASQLVKIVTVNYFTHVMEKAVTLQGSAIFGPQFAPAFLASVSDIANSTVSLGYNGSLRGFKSGIYGIVEHVFDINGENLTVNVRVGGLQNNILGIIQASGTVFGKTIFVQGNIYQNGEYNLEEVDQLIDLKAI